MTGRKNSVRSQVIESTPVDKFKLTDSINLKKSLSMKTLMVRDYYKVWVIIAEAETWNGKQNQFSRECFKHKQACYPE